MSYEQYRYVFIIGLILCVLMLIVSVILFFYLNIAKVIGDLSGANARKAIDDIRSQNEKTGYKTYKSSAVNRERGKVTDKISPSGQLEKKHTMQVGTVTSKIFQSSQPESSNGPQIQDNSSQYIESSYPNTQETTVLGGASQETTVLGATSQETTILDSTSQETTVLDSTSQETTVLDSTSQETTVLDSTSQETTVLDSTSPETTILGATSPETTVLDCTMLNAATSAVYNNVQNDDWFVVEYEIVFTQTDEVIPLGGM